MIKRAEIAQTYEVDGKVIFELRPAYHDIPGVEPVVDCGPPSDEAKAVVENLFGKVRLELKRRKVLEAVDRARRLAVGTGMTITIGEAG